MTAAMAINKTKIRHEKEALDVASLSLFSTSWDDGSVVSTSDRGSVPFDAVAYLFSTDGVSVGCMGAIDGAVVAFRIVGVVVGRLVVVLGGFVVEVVAVVFVVVVVALADDDDFFVEHLKSGGGSTEY